MPDGTAVPASPLHLQAMRRGHPGLQEAEGDRAAAGVGGTGRAVSIPGRCPPGPRGLETPPSALGVPPEERPDLSHRPLAGGGFQRSRAQSSPLHTPLPTSGAPQCEPLTPHPASLLAHSPWESPAPTPRQLEPMGPTLLEIVSATKEPSAAEDQKDQELTEGGGPGWGVGVGRAVCKCSSMLLLVCREQKVEGEPQLGSTALWLAEVLRGK